MVNQRDIRTVRHELNSLRNTYEDLENLMEYAEALEVDTTNVEDATDRHQEFLDELEAFYYTVENILARADRIEDDHGEVKHELPAAVPEHVRDRVANRPDNRPGPSPPGQSDDQSPPYTGS